MSDWTTGSVTIHSCPRHRVRQVVDTLEYYGLVTDGTVDGRKVVTVGKAHTADEFRVNDACKVADTLMKRAPEATFTVFEAPTYGWVGTTCSYVPELGLFTEDCNDVGEPLFNRTEILRWDHEPEEVRQRRLGVSWLTAIAAIPCGEVVEPASFAAQWDRGRGEVIVVEGKECGGDLSFTVPVTATTVDVAFAVHGFVRADDWTRLDEASSLWCADAYRTSSH